MEHRDFWIGLEFRLAGHLYRCTDVGMRTVAVIRIDQVEKATHNEDGTISYASLSRPQAEVEGWFSGPPYAVSEQLFDEDDIEQCEPLVGG